MAKELNLPVTNLEKPYLVRLPDGSKSKIYQTVENLPYKIQEHKGTVSLHVTPLKINTIIFGNTWLAKYNPSIDWQNLTATLRKATPPVTIKADKKSNFEWIKHKELTRIIKEADPDTQSRPRHPILQSRTRHRRPT